MGHRAAHASFAGREEPVEAALRDEFAVIDDGVQSARGLMGPTRLHTLLADGTDLVAAELALARGWDLVAPLPFGRALNCADRGVGRSDDCARRRHRAYGGGRA